jgi:ATP-dependent DNA ligase
VPHETVRSPENDGYRALLARYADGRVVIRSRRGTDMTAAFPEITAAALVSLEVVP